MSKQPQKPESATCCDRPIGSLIEPRFFKALCDPTRITILARLADYGGECTVSEVARCVTVDISVVSRHLAVLREAGIVQSRKRGKEVCYSVRYDRLVDTLRAVADAIEACCPGGTCGAPNQVIESITLTNRKN